MKMFYHIWSEFAFSTLLSYAVKQHEHVFCQTKFCGPCYRRCWTKLSFLIVASLSPMEKNKPLHPRCKLHVHVFHLKLLVSNCALLWNRTLLMYELFWNFWIAALESPQCLRSLISCFPILKNSKDWASQYHRSCRKRQVPSLMYCN